MSRPGGIQVQPGPVEDNQTPWRTLEYVALVRALIASALILSAVANRPSFDWSASPSAVGSVVYFGLAAAAAILSVNFHRAFFPQLAIQIAIDLIAVSFLLISTRDSAAAILYLLPLTGAALMLPAIAVFLVCSLAVFVLLIEAVLQFLRFEASSAAIVQAGLSGATLFAVAALLQFLASRLAEQERLARNRGKVIEGQLEINRLVIAQMEQGAIVVDSQTRVRANNRAARLLLGLDADAQLTGRKLADFPSLAALVSEFQRWRTTGPNSLQSPREAAFVVPGLGLRARFVRPQRALMGEFAIFLEDQQQMEIRAQQLKLAAMGRLTASITHEIRNPLGAIGHAAQLLIEDADRPTTQRLARIVHENTRRLNQLIEDVLRVARRDQPLGDDLDLSTFLSDWVEELIHDRELDRSAVRLQTEALLRVRFEETQLRHVLLNLVDNALRYASGGSGSVTILAERPLSDASATGLVWVFDDGPGVPEDKQANLFEPFFTTEGRGTGLGLYMAREFCVLNRAELAYAVRRGIDKERRGFRITFGDATQHQEQATSPLPSQEHR